MDSPWMVVFHPDDAMVVGETSKIDSDNEVKTNASVRFFKTPSPNWLFDNKFYLNSKMFSSHIIHLYL
jgi:hypothetical protein